MESNHHLYSRNSWKPSKPEIKVGTRVMVPRSSGRKTRGTVLERHGDSCKVQLDQLGRRGQNLGKIVWAYELDIIS